jgi:hypothetical protein
LNLAIKAQKNGEKATVVDLDIVNPYFRTADYSQLLHNEGIRVISPASAGTTVDTPALTAEMYSIFDKVDEFIIIDVGGDDAGATALGRFSKQIINSGKYEMLYVINKFRKLISTPEEAAELLNEIESASRIKATGIINNSHLSDLTTAEDILSSMGYAQKTAALTGLPLVATTAPLKLKGELCGSVPNLYPVDIIVKLPWNQ